MQGSPVVSEERVGGRAGTAAPQGVVCELPNPPVSTGSFFPLIYPFNFNVAGGLSRDLVLGCYRDIPVT